MLVTQSHPHDVSLPRFPKPMTQSTNTPDLSPQDIAQTWLDQFSTILSSADISALPSIIHQDSWWRDHVALSWDLRTLHGLPAITSFLTPVLSSVHMRSLSLAKSGKYAPSMSAPIPGLDWVQSMFSFETEIGRGRGMLRLAQGGDGIWKAHMLYTALDEIKGHEEASGKRRPHGGKNSLPGGIAGGNWFERRQKTFNFEKDEPVALLIGAGQAGLNLGARLQALGIPTLIVDRQKRIGDNWRECYRTLVTHDPVTYTHMAYLPFPSNWPLFTPKDKLGDWFEAYASMMELNVWTSTSVVSSSYSTDEKRWEVKVLKADGSERVFHPRHVVLCTGHSGEPKIPSFPGQDDFKGTIYHGSMHKDANDQSSIPGKKVIVVGTGNSGHDIAQNYCEAGAAVTMLQRSGTYVLQVEKGGHMLHAGTYDDADDCPPTEDSDIFAQSLPMPVQFALGIDLTKKIAELEKENLEGLKKAGFEVDFGHDGSGLFRKYMTKGGGYYLDVGASQLICEGKIKVLRSPEGIKGFDTTALVLADGRRLDADVVVLATGYDNMRTSARKILGDSVADKAKDVWDLDEEGEMNAIWRPSGHPGFWYMGGNLALCRIYSKFLALQIKACEEGLSDV